jgi:DNA-binding NtrC family response regulator
MPNLHPNAKFKLLIVEDDEMLRDAMIFEFKRHGFTLFSAENGVQALTVVAAERIDLVISDICMPKGDGLELLKKIRARDPKVPIVILMTGFSDSSAEDCIKLGAWKVLPKPFDRKSMLTAVLEALKIPDPKREAK